MDPTHSVFYERAAEEEKAKPALEQPHAAAARFRIDSRADCRSRQPPAYGTYLKGCRYDLGLLAQHRAHSVEVLVPDFGVQLLGRVQLQLLRFRGEILATLSLLLRGKFLRREFHISY